MASPELQTVIDMMRSSPVLSGGTIEDMRAGLEAAIGQIPLPEGVHFEAVDAGGVPGEWTIAEGAEDDRALVYFHGGGYTIGSIATHRMLVAAISAAARARVLSVDYRLAPEHPFPAAVDDGVAACRFVHARGFAPAKTAVAGDSAGGGLTVATLLALRDQGFALPAAGVCISPWLDLCLSGDSVAARKDLDPMVQERHLRQMANAYLGGTDPRSPLASPLFADLSGLPPILVHVGTAEILHDDSTRFAERARAAKVSVSLEVWDEMIHVWHTFAPLLPEANQAIARIGEYLRERLGGSGTT